ncbi:putative inner membrane domain protein [Chlamydia psittaci 03DC29]|nr:putative inner membrane domain protein [Chlamydia psittaci 03DC29]
MPALQVLLVATVGSSVASTVLPMASSGLVYNVFQCKARLHIAKARWKEAKAKSQFKKQLMGGIGFSKAELNKAWLRVGKDTILETDRAIREEIANFEKGRGVNSVIVAGIFVIAGVGIMLLTLIPALAPIMAGVLAIGSTLMVIGAAMYLQKFTTWLYNHLVTLRERLYSRRNYLSDISRKMQISTEDLIVDANFDDIDLDRDGNDDTFANAFGN